MKKCNYCKQVKPKTEFAKRSKSGDGRSSQCKVCAKEAQHKRYWSNPEKYRKFTSDSRKKQTIEQRYISNKNANLRKKYGISYNEYVDMLQKQEYRCACCGEHRDNVGKSGLVVDHNHTTGEVRELLCNACNMALGGLREDERIITNLLKYVRKHNGNS